MAVTFNRDGRLIASAGFEDATVCIGDAESGEQLQVIEAPPTLTHLAFSPDDQRLAAVGFQGVVRIWSTANWLDVFSLTGLAPRSPGDFGYNARVAFSPSGSRIASTNWDGSINVWDATPLEQLPAERDSLPVNRLDPQASFAIQRQSRIWRQVRAAISPAAT
jgi:WD40 repeat protein